MNVLTTCKTLESSIFTANQALFKRKQQSGYIEEIASQSHTYEYTFETSLKHTNATQNIYFSNYVEWQGTVRERWFFNCIDESMLQEEGVFVTKEAHQYYIKEGLPFDTIVCHLNTFHIQRCGFRLLFRFYSDNVLMSYGYQHVAFINHSKKIARLPENIISKIEEFYISTEPNMF